MKTVSNSELSMWRRCRVEHDFNYVQLRRSRAEADALRIGTAIHYWLENYWLSDVSVPFQGKDDFETESMRAMVDGYAARWKQENEQYNVIAVEHKFSVPLTDDTNYVGMADVLVRDAAGDLWLMEHKTSSEDITPGSVFWRRKTLDTQASLYMWAMRELGTPVCGVIYDVLKKPQLRPLRAGKNDAETAEEYRLRIREDMAAKHDEYFQRVTISRTYAELNEASHAALKQYVDMVYESLYRNPDACYRYGKFCDYHMVCTGILSIDDNNKYRTAKTKHEELL